MSLHWYMDWDLVKAQSGVTIRRISNCAAFLVGHSSEILELLPGSMKQEFPTSETPKQARTFYLYQSVHGGEGRIPPV